MVYVRLIAFLVQLCCNVIRIGYRPRWLPHQACFDSSIKHALVKLYIHQRLFIHQLLHLIQIPNERIRRVTKQKRSALFHLSPAKRAYVRRYPQIPEWFYNRPDKETSTQRRQRLSVLRDRGYWDLPPDTESEPEEMEIDLFND